MNAELTSQEIRAEISKWIGRLFDNDVSLVDIRLHVEDLVGKVLSEQLRAHRVTYDSLQKLFLGVESSLKEPGHGTGTDYRGPAAAAK